MSNIARVKPVSPRCPGLEQLRGFRLSLIYITTIYIYKIVEDAQAMNNFMSKFEDAQTPEQHRRCSSEQVLVSVRKDSVLTEMESRRCSSIGPLRAGAKL
jgi:hypothetical protein